MNIVVCIKQVPDTTEVKINPETNTLIREGVPSVVNPFDENAVEEALRLRDKHGGKVTVITMGPPQASSALRHTIAMGADEAILISDRVFAGSDTLATSYALSCAIKKIGAFDLILCGKQAIDGDTAQVGPGIAEWLNVPQITFAVKLEAGDGVLKAERLLEEANEVVEVKLPVMASVVKQINEPRYPSLKGQMRAKKVDIPVWSAADISADPEKVGQKGSPTWVVKIFNPPRKGGGEVLHGEPCDTASQVVSKLKERKLF